MREHRPVYCDPPSNGAGGVQVCVGFVSAGLTPKLGLAFPVALVDVPTLAALLARVAWIDRNARNPSLLGLVFDKGAKLPEGPVVQAFPLLFVGLGPCPDVREVFKHNAEFGAFSSGNDAFRNAMVLVFVESPLLAAHLAQSLLRGASADTLQERASSGVAFAVCLDGSAGMLFAEAVGGYVHDTEVHTKHAVRREQVRFVEVAHGRQVPLAANEHQINFSFAMREQLALVVAADVGDLGAAGQHPQRYDVVGLERQDSVVVGLRSMFAKNALRFLVDLVGIGNFRDAANRHLRRQLKAFAQFAIERFVHVKLTCRFRCETLLRQPVASLVAALKRGAQLNLLLFRRLQSDVSNQFHASIMEFSCMLVKRQESSPSGCPLSLPTPKGGGISLENR